MPDLGPSCDSVSLDELAAIPTLRNPPSDSIHSLDPADLDDNARLNDSDLLLDLSLNVLAEISTEDCSSNDLSWNDVSMLFAHFENDNTTCQCWKCKTNSKLHYMSRRPINRNFKVRQRTLKNVESVFSGFSSRIFGVYYYFRILVDKNFQLVR